MHKPLTDEDRRLQLDALIKAIFGHLQDHELAVLASRCERTETRMFEVLRVRPRSSVVVDLFDDTELKPVRFPKELLPYLREHDVFRGTLGLRNSVWTVLELSPGYEMMEIDYEDDPDDLEIDGRGLLH